MTTDRLSADYRLLGVPESCSEHELRRAYLAMLKRCHPDLNDGDTTAGHRTVEVIEAYERITEQRDALRHARTRMSRKTGSPKFGPSDAGDAGPIDINKVAAIKSELYEAWMRWQDAPQDLASALRLVHSALKANRADLVASFLSDSLLVDSALLLREVVGLDEARETLLRWARLIGGPQELTILEDLNESDMGTPETAASLRRCHYSAGVNPNLPLETRIEHFKRILELGFEYGYVYKLIAEILHDMGDDASARAHLEKAYVLDPELTGAKTISRALGFIGDAAPRRESETSLSAVARTYAYWRNNQVPSASQIRDWSRDGRWEVIRTYADIATYSPSQILRSRPMLRQISIALGTCRERWAVEALSGLINSRYPDIQRPAALSLARLGDDMSVEVLTGQINEWHQSRSYSDGILRYLHARRGMLARSVLGDGCDSRSVETLGNELRRAVNAFELGNSGESRAILEAVLPLCDSGSELYDQALLLLARSCATMGDHHLAVELVRDQVELSPELMRHTLLAHLFSWLWSDLVLCENNAPYDYDCAFDDEYAYTLWCGYEAITGSTGLDEMLTHIIGMARLLGYLGEVELCDNLARCVRRAAPGTRFAECFDLFGYRRDATIDSCLDSVMEWYRENLLDVVELELGKALPAQEC